MTNNLEDRDPQDWLAAQFDHSDPETDDRAEPEDRDGSENGDTDPATAPPRSAAPSEPTAEAFAWSLTTDAAPDAGATETTSESRAFEPVETEAGALESRTAEAASPALSQPEPASATPTPIAATAEPEEADSPESAVVPELVLAGNSETAAESARPYYPPPPVTGSSSSMAADSNAPRNPSEPKAVNGRAPEDSGEKAPSASSGSGSILLPSSTGSGPVAAGATDAPNASDSPSLRDAPLPDAGEEPAAAESEAAPSAMDDVMNAPSPRRAAREAAAALEAAAKSAAKAQRRDDLPVSARAAANAGAPVSAVERPQPAVPPADEVKDGGASNATDGSAGVGDPGQSTEDGAPATSDFDSLFRASAPEEQSNVRPVSAGQDQDAQPRPFADAPLLPVKPAATGADAVSRAPAGKSSAKAVRVPRMPMSTTQKVLLVIAALLVVVLTVILLVVLNQVGITSAAGIAPVDAGPTALAWLGPLTL